MLARARDRRGAGECQRVVRGPRLRAGVSRAWRRARGRRAPSARARSQRVGRDDDVRSVARAAASLRSRVRGACHPLDRPSRAHCEARACARACGVLALFANVPNHDASPAHAEIDAAYEAHSPGMTNPRWRAGGFNFEDVFADAHAFQVVLWHNSPVATSRFCGAGGPGRARSPRKARTTGTVLRGPRDYQCTVFISYVTGLQACVAAERRPQSIEG